jgi:ankyrin repeat protein
MASTPSEASIGLHDADSKKALLELKPDARSSCGWTALPFAAYVGNEEVVRLLLQRGDFNPDTTAPGWKYTIDLFSVEEP